MTLIKSSEFIDRLGFRHIEVCLDLFFFKITLYRFVADRLFWPKVYEFKCPELLADLYHDPPPSPSESESSKIASWMESDEYKILVKFWRWEKIALESQVMAAEESLDFIRGKIWGLNHTIRTIVMIALFQEEQAFMDKMTKDETDLAEVSSSLAKTYKNMARMDRLAR